MPPMVAVERNGGVEVDGGFKFPNRRAARQATSEMAGDLGSDAQAIRARDFRGGPYWMKDSDMVIGRQSADGKVGWRNDFLGHDFGDSSPGPHVNIWDRG
jgi:hypothetical protein